jgi:hypothetical protein
MYLSQVPSVSPEERQLEGWPKSVAEAVDEAI